MYCSLDCLHVFSLANKASRWSLHLLATTFIRYILLTKLETLPVLKPGIVVGPIESLSQWSITEAKNSVRPYKSLHCGCYCQI